jgi:hypothetical protein
MSVLDKEATAALASLSANESFDKQDITQVLQSVCEYFKAKHENNSALELNHSERLNNLFAICYHIIRAGLQKDAEVEDLRAELALNQFINPYLALVVSAYKFCRSVRIPISMEHNSLTRYPTLEKLRWRLDVIISSSSLSRVFKPILLFEIALSDGTLTTVECSIEMFHRLRYAVARSLNKVEYVENHLLYKLQ